MTSMMAGATSGLLMGSVFVGAGALMLFVLARDASPAAREALHRWSSGRVVMGVVVASYPTWAVIGAVMGLLYEISAEQAPGAGLGSPNLVFTLAIVVVAVMMAAPFAILLRRVVTGVLAIAGAFVGVFGWFLPFFAT